MRDSVGQHRDPADNNRNDMRVRFNDRTWAAIVFLAEYNGLPPAVVVRMLVQNAIDEINEGVTKQITNSTAA